MLETTQTSITLERLVAVLRGGRPLLNLLGVGAGIPDEARVPIGNKGAQQSYQIVKMFPDQRPP